MFVNSTNKKFDFRSDTLTTPSKEMIGLLSSIDYGDNAFGEDKTVQDLENECAKLFGKKASLFIPTGTMSNQIALRALTSPGDEVIIDKFYHIFYYESAQSSQLAQINFNTIETKDGVLTVEQIKDVIQRKPRGYSYASPSLICLENTINSSDGLIFPFEELKSIYDFSKKNGMKVHLDGARIFNAAAESEVSLKDYGKVCDTMNICFAKGLGAPAGSVLVGDKDVIKKAKKYRKWYGGSIHQIGIIAGPALFSIKNNIPQLKIDNNLAKEFSGELENLAGVKVLNEVQTNIVLFKTKTVNRDGFIENCNRKGVKFYPWTENSIRAVTHMGLCKKDLPRIMKIIKSEI